jgi:hypothetical protein
MKKKVNKETINDSSSQMLSEDKGNTVQAPEPSNEDIQEIIDYLSSSL